MIIRNRVHRVALVAAVIWVAAGGIAAAQSRGSAGAERPEIVAADTGFGRTKPVAHDADQVAQAGHDVPDTRIHTGR